MSFSRLSSKTRILHLLSNTKRSLSTDIAIQEDPQVEYPPVKPKFPPGNWGNLDRKTAWKRYEEEQTIRGIPTVQERLDYFGNKGTGYGRKLWIYSPLCYMPRLLDYQQDKTKSVLVEGTLPEIYNNLKIDNEFAQLKPLINEIILAEHEKITRKKFSPYTSTRHLSFPEYILSNIVYTLISVLSSKHDHLQQGILGESVPVEAFWDRFGTRRPSPKKRSKPEHINDGIPRTGDEDKYVAAQGYEESAEFHGRFQARFQFRVEKPLPEFIPSSDSLCTEAVYPKSPYFPTALGQSFRWNKLETQAGYKAGDPCEFGLFSLLRTNLLNMDIYQKQFGEHYAEMARKGYGLNASFLWTVAQAYNQGFNSYVDITYPFTTQTILSDGKTFSFHAYQLNTLQLWKCDDSNPLRNICWQLPEEKLYDVVENGEVKGFNDDVFKNILKFFLLKPVDRDNSKPTIPPDSPDHVKKDTLYVDEREIVVVEEKKQEYDLS